MNKRIVKQQRNKAMEVKKYTNELSGLLFNTEESVAYLKQKFSEHGIRVRKSFYGPVNTFKMFLRQTMSDKKSCRKTINDQRSEMRMQKKRVAKIDTGNYCNARKRIPLSVIKDMAIEIATVEHDDAPCDWKWRNRSVKVIDGTTIDAPDTKANQAAFPQPSSQAAGLGFPKIRLLGMISLATGTMLNLAIGKYSGKGSGELSLLRSLFGEVKPRDILLGDTIFGTYANMVTLIQKGADGLFPLYGGRNSGAVRKISGTDKDCIVEWLRPQQKPEWMSKEEFKNLPENILVREIQVRLKDGSKKTLVTTMTNPLTTHKDLSELYKKRYNAIELPLRDIKCTMGLDELSCKTPEMLVKEIWMHMLAYNLIRSIMANSARKFAALPQNLGFLNAMQSIVTVAKDISTCAKRYFNSGFDYLLESISFVKVGFQVRADCLRHNKKRKKCLRILTNPAELLKWKKRNVS